MSLSAGRRSRSTCPGHDACSLSWGPGRLESGPGALPRGARCSYHSSQHSRCTGTRSSSTNQAPRFSCESIRRQIKHASFPFMCPSEVMCAAKSDGPRWRETPEHSRCQRRCNEVVRWEMFSSGTPPGSLLAEVSCVRRARPGAADGWHAHDNVATTPRVGTGQERHRARLGRAGAVRRRGRGRHERVGAEERARPEVRHRDDLVVGCLSEADDTMIERFAAAP
jgi:hypothetical protein